MDAFVQLALIEKSKRVFAADASTFLSFPLLSPLTVTAESLGALATPQTQADYARAADFARQVNFLPRDIVASLDGDRYLWDVYGDVIARADVATGSSGLGTNNSTVLYDVAADGTRTESAAYRAYRQYRDAWFVAREDYGARQSTGQAATDPAEKQHWTDVEEPALRAVLAKAESDWDSLGHRAEIEAALQAEAISAANDPVKRWKEWSDAFNPDIDLLPDTGGRYAPTGISPSDFATSTAWPHFDLSTQEMASLVAGAPEELKVVLDGHDRSTIDHVSFEYRSVAVVRPWFRATALTSRIWRSTDPDLILSDGAAPPSGACPAYVSALVFIRNLTVTQRTPVPAAPSDRDLRFTLRADQLTRRPLRMEPQLAPGNAVLLNNATAPFDATRFRAFRRLDTQSFTAAPAPTRQFAAPVPRFVARESVAAAGVTGRVVAPAATSPLNRPTVDYRIRRRIPDVVAQGTGPVVAIPVQPPSPPQPPDALSVLAFICKRLPKTPDASPDLHWP